MNELLEQATNIVKERGELLGTDLPRSDLIELAKEAQIRYSRMTNAYLANRLTEYLKEYIRRKAQMEEEENIEIVEIVEEEIPESSKRKRSQPTTEEALISERCTITDVNKNIVKERDDLALRYGSITGRFIPQWDEALLSKHKEQVSLVTRLLKLEELLHQHNIRLAEIDSLLQLELPTVEPKITKANEWSCPICMESGKIRWVLQPCFHVFCVDCVKNTPANCFVCRSHVLQKNRLFD